MAEFPLSIHGVKRMGVEKWLETATPWPVSPEELYCLFEEVEALFLATAMEASPPSRDVLVTVVKIIIEYVMALHGVLVAKRVGRNGRWMGIECGVPYCEVLGTDPTAGAARAVERLTQVRSIRRRLEDRARLFRDTAYGTVRRGSVPAGKGDGSDLALAFGQPRRLTLEWASKKGLHVRRIQPTMLMPRRDVMGSPDLEETAGRLSAGLEAIAERHGIELTEHQTEYLRQVTSESFRRSEDLIGRARRFLSHRRASYLLLPALGRFEARALASAARETGHEVVGEGHGGGVAGLYQRGGFPQIDLSITDTYLVTSGRQERFIRRLAEEYPLARARGLSVVGVGSGNEEGLWQRHRSEPRPERVRTVMIIEYPLTPHAHDQALNFWAHQVDLTVRIGRILREGGFHTILKLHPERISESTDVYDDHFDAVLTAPFEEVHEVADAYLFPQISSTTFGFAVLTNRPVVFFDVALRDLWEEVHPSLRKRGRVIPSRVENGAFLFDEEELLECLRQPPDPPDEEFIREYMLS